MGDVLGCRIIECSLVRGGGRPMGASNMSWNACSN